MTSLSASKWKSRVHVLQIRYCCCQSCPCGSEGDVCESEVNLRAFLIWTLDEAEWVSGQRHALASMPPGEESPVRIGRTRQEAGRGGESSLAVREPDQSLGHTKTPAVQFLTVHQSAFLCLLGRTMAQVVSRLPLTDEARVRVLISPCGIRGGQSGTARGFCQSSSVVPCQYNSAVDLNNHVSSGG
jgi:hypothetical protein